MPTPLREAVLAAVAARLATHLPAVTVERARRGEVTPGEAPILVLTGGDMTPDQGQEPTVTHWTVEFFLQGWATGPDDLTAEQALSQLHADAVAAFEAWFPEDPQIQVTAGETVFESYDPEDSSPPFGAFAMRCSALAFAPSGSPYHAP